jgi:hypothetical protein
MINVLRDCFIGGSQSRRIQPHRPISKKIPGVIWAWILAVAFRTIRSNILAGRCFFAREVLRKVVDSLKIRKGEEDGTSFA